MSVSGDGDGSGRIRYCDAACRVYMSLLWEAWQRRLVGDMIRFIPSTRMATSGEMSRLPGALVLWKTAKKTEDRGQHTAHSGGCAAADC